MKTEIKTVELKSVTAAEGMVATNGEIYSEVGGTIYIPPTDSGEEFYEITEEEYAAIMADKNKELGDTTL